MIHSEAKERKPDYLIVCLRVDGDVGVDAKHHLLCNYNSDNNYCGHLMRRGNQDLFLRK